MSLEANVLRIPQGDLGQHGIALGNVVCRVVDRQGKGFQAQYNPGRRAITILNTSDLPPEILTAILYEPEASHEYAKREYYPVVMEERDKDGNLEVKFSDTPSAVNPEKRDATPRVVSRRIVTDIRTPMSWERRIPQQGPLPRIRKQ